MAPVEGRAVLAHEAEPVAAGPQPELEHSEGPGAVEEAAAAVPTAGRRHTSGAAGADHELAHTVAP